MRQSGNQRQLLDPQLGFLTVDLQILKTNTTLTLFVSFCLRSFDCSRSYLAWWRLIHHVFFFEMAILGEQYHTNGSHIQIHFQRALMSMCHTPSTSQHQWVIPVIYVDFIVRCSQSLFVNIMALQISNEYRQSTYATRLQLSPHRLTIRLSRASRQDFSDYRTSRDLVVTTLEQRGNLPVRQWNDADY
jgi:hypothetical protein